VARGGWLVGQCEELAACARPDDPELFEVLGTRRLRDLTTADVADGRSSS
jgi:hypothetical protein